MNGIQGRDCFSILQTAHTESGALSAFFPVGTGVLSLGLKRPRRESNHPNPVPRLRISRDITLRPLCTSKAWTGKLYILFHPTDVVSDVLLARLSYSPKPLHGLPISALE